MDTTTTTATPAASATLAQDDRVSQHLRTLVDEAEALLKATARAGDEKYDATRERLGDEVRRLRARLGEFEAETATRVKQAARQTDVAVHAHPYAAMGTAAAVGLLLGYLLAQQR